MREALGEFLRHLSLERNASAHTVKSYREDLTGVIGFLESRLGGGSPRPQQISTRLLRAYLAFLHEQGYARSTIARRLAAVRSWCRYLCRQGTLASNPAQGLRGPRQEKKDADQNGIVTACNHLATDYRKRTNFTSKLDVTYPG